MNTCAIDMADAVVRRYKTRDPEEIISRRAINLKEIRYCHDLLGYYTVLLNCEYIGINSNCTNDYSRSVARYAYGENIGGSRPTIIGNNVFIGMNSTVLMGSNLLRYALSPSSLQL